VQHQTGEHVRVAQIGELPADAPRPAPDPLARLLRQERLEHHERLLHARIVSRAFRPNLDVKVLKPLSPGGAAGGAIAGLSALPADTSVVLVGHEPDLWRLAGAFVLEHRDAMRAEFKKGGVCRIDLDDVPRVGDRRLIYLLPPRVLRDDEHCRDRRDLRHRRRPAAHRLRRVRPEGRNFLGSSVEIRMPLRRLRLESQYSGFVSTGL
jgi:hypothetical protein